MKTEHTAGPWTVSRRNSGMIPVHFQPPCVLARGGNMTIADGLGDGPEAEANALLIASAPDLLAALEECITSEGAACFGDMKNHPEWMQRRLYSISNIARAALAKAKGQ